MGAVAVFARVYAPPLMTKCPISFLLDGIGGGFKLDIAYIQAYPAADLSSEEMVGIAVATIVEFRAAMKSVIWAAKSEASTQCKESRTSDPVQIEMKYIKRQREI